MCRLPELGRNRSDPVAGNSARQQDPSGDTASKYRHPELQSSTPGRPERQPPQRRNASTRQRQSDENRNQGLLGQSRNQRV